VEYQDENIFTGTWGDVWKSVVTGYITTKKPLKDCNQEIIKKKQQISNGFHLGRII
jgi:hypothetical protein